MDGDFTLGSGYNSDSGGGQDNTPAPPAATADQNQPAQPPPPQAAPAQPAQNPPDSQEDALQQELRVRKEAIGADESAARDKEWANKQYQQILEQPMPKMPSFEEAYPQPKAQPATKGLSSGDKMKQVLGYLAVAIPMAIALGGTRRGMGGQALAGLAMGMRSIQEGWTEQAQQSSRIWKAQNDAMAKYGKEQMSYYKDVIQNRKTNLQEKMQLIGHIAEQSKDDAMAKHAEAGDWGKMVDTLTKREKLFDEHKKQRAQNEDKIMKTLGNGAEYEDYKQHLMEKDPSLRKAAESGDNQAYIKEYDKAVEKYPWTKFLDEKQAKSVAESKAKKEASSSLEEEAKPSETPQDTSDLDGAADALAKKLRGGF